MSQEAVEKLLGRLITDARFRQQAEELLGTACRQGGYVLSPEEINLVATADLGKFAELGNLLNPGLRRAA